MSQQTILLILVFGAPVGTTLALLAAIRWKKRHPHSHSVV